MAPIFFSATQHQGGPERSEFTFQLSTAVPALPPITILLILSFLLLDFRPSIYLMIVLLLSVQCSTGIRTIVYDSPPVYCKAFFTTLFSHISYTPTYSYIFPPLSHSYPFRLFLSYHLPGLFLGCKSVHTSSISDFPSQLPSHLHIYLFKVDLILNPYSFSPYFSFFKNF